MKKLLMSFMLTFCLSVYAADGSLDSSFGTDGKVITDFSGGFDWAEAIAVQPDGKIVVAGLSDSNFGLVRYNADGSLDSSFGIGGKVTTDFGGSDHAYSVQLQPDGKIVAAGRGNSVNFGLARYNTDGSLDSSFGTGGKVTTDFGGSDLVYSVQLQPDGKIVAAGRGNSVDFGLARYNTDGSLDSSFGTGGKVTTDFGGSDLVFSVQLQPDGKIVAAGLSDSNFGLARYNTDGSLDSSFGTGGKITTDFGDSDRAFSVQLQPDGKIVVAGTVGTQFGLVRYNQNGSLDSSFGVGGKVVIPLGVSAYRVSLILQPDGKLIAAGADAVDFVLIRCNTNGSLDTSFGTAGRVITSLSANDDGATKAVIQPDGKLVVVGYTHSSSSFAFGLVRYLLPSLDISPLARDLRAKYFLLQ